ncbi:class I SAM-dependent methyltransferase [Nocardia sp. CS682]|uniref:class I SAM-dependent methyltransferase n=1 Tax=Nocardia sp. CS682 TaxID=1047172 RepID=UPI0010757E32|nr:methyltransferase [Nocardia sp. CS682]QBS40220.1 translation initiation factor IF-2 [Nocardia sp. CS682]
MQSHTISHRRGSSGWMFLREAVRDLRTTGAIAPSSRRLAAALTEPVRAQAWRPLAVLEAGAGTGSVTRALLPLIGPGSRLDVVEPNPHFAQHLRELVHGCPGPAGTARRVHLHESFVEQLDTGCRYDVIVSGLPFTNFTPAEVERIMNRYFELLHPGGTLTFFAYRGTRMARSILASRAEATRHRLVDDVLHHYRDRYSSGREHVWGNLPPADVWRLQTPVAAEASRDSVTAGLIDSGIRRRTP